MDCAVRPNLTSAQAGLAAEMLVCFDLARRGITPVPNPVAGAPYDVLADAGRRLLKIQVKSTARAIMKAKGGGHGKPQPTYAFGLNKGREGRYADIDLFAFVALDIPLVFYVAPKDLLADARYQKKHIGAARFRQDAPTSFERFWITQ